jgi:HAD superfamily hydrolase (TIGR01549 family)
LKQLDTYKTLVFDCDGVVLNSNKVKTEAFRQAALPYGQAAADALATHHVANGGISRYLKFRHFLDHIAPGPRQEGELETLLDSYAQQVRAGLASCEIASGLAELRSALPNMRWMIVSGGDQNELRELFAERGIAHFFDAGIFGSPDRKELILDRELASGNLTRPALFLGDSRYDISAAEHAGLDFVFLHGWTEVEDWQAMTTDGNIVSRINVHEILSAHAVAQ